MCIIICCDKKSGHPNKKMLKSAEQFNQDGMGISWINRDNMVEWRKGLNSKQVLKVIKKVKPSLKKGYIVHARIASIGAICPELTHPFEISKDANMELSGTTDKGVLFHNGTWFEHKALVMKTLIKNNIRMYKGENSDSRSMAFLAHMFGMEFLNLLDDQKIAVLTPKGIKRYGDFPKVDKHYCSNDYINLTEENTNRMYDVYGNYDYNDSYNNTSYCASCDRNLKENKFTMDYDECDECFKRRTNKNMDTIIDENFINAKQYMKNTNNSWWDKHGKGAI